MAMHDPPHPGGIVRRQCLEPLGLTVTRAAEGLGVTRQARGHAGEITVERDAAARMDALRARLPAVETDQIVRWIREEREPRLP